MTLLAFHKPKGVIQYLSIVIFFWWNYQIDTWWPLMEDFAWWWTKSIRCITHIWPAPIGIDLVLVLGMVSWGDHRRTLICRWTRIVGSLSSSLESLIEACKLGVVYQNAILPKFTLLVVNPTNLLRSLRSKLSAFLLLGERAGLILVVFGEAN